MRNTRSFWITLAWTLQSVLFAARAGSAETVPADLSRLETLIERQGRLLSAQEARLAELERQNSDLQARLDALVANSAPPAQAVQVTNATVAQAVSAALSEPDGAAARLAFTKPNGFFGRAIRLFQIRRHP
jgi:hypothetical protein